MIKQCDECEGREMEKARNPNNGRKSDGEKMQNLINSREREEWGEYGEAVSAKRIRKTTRQTCAKGNKSDLERKESEEAAKRLNVPIMAGSRCLFSV